MEARELPSKLGHFLFSDIRGVLPLHRNPQQSKCLSYTTQHRSCHYGPGQLSASEVLIRSEMLTLSIAPLRSDKNQLHTVFLYAQCKCSDRHLHEVTRNNEIRAHNSEFSYALLYFVASYVSEELTEQIHQSLPTRYGQGCMRDVKLKTKPALYSRIHSVSFQLILMTLV